MSEVQALPTETPDEVSSLLLPLADGQLLVPVDVLSEVVAVQTPVSVYDAPDWYLGEINWRDLRLPLVSFEVMRGQPLASMDGNTRIAVLSAGGDKVPFFALLLQGTPRLVRVTPEQIVQREEACAPGELMHVSLAGEAAVLPDFVSMERAFLEFRQRN